MGSSALLLKGGVTQPKSVVETYAISNSFAVGQVVRYNGTSWVLAQANTAENSEVVGVVSTAAPGSFDVTYSGFIASAVSASNAPVLFLSADTAGALSNTPPSVIGSVVKPILTKTSSGWLVNNYLGTQIGGSSTISVDQIQPVGSIMPFAGSSIPDTWLTCDGTAYAISSYGELYSALQNSTGSRAPLHGYVAVLTVVATTGFIIGQSVTQTLPAGTVLSGTVIAIGTSPVTLTIQTIPTYSSTTKNFSYPNAIFTSGLIVTNGTNSQNVTSVSVTKFNTPNLRGRFAVGENLTAIPDSETDGTFSSLVNTYGLGAVGGQESTVAGTGTATGTNAFVTSVTTSGGLISNIPPYVATKYIIKAKPYTRAAIIDGIDIPYSYLLVTDLRSGLLRGAGVGDDLLFKTNNSLTDYGTERMRLTSGGSLGIGTQTPVKLLDVAGTINATGAITSASLATTGAITSASLAATGNITTTSGTFVGKGTIPIGGIIMWSGAVIPASWALCNGLNGTPNLQDKFIVGAGSVYAVNAIGGSATASLVDHRHIYGMDDNTPNINIIDNYGGPVLSNGGAQGGGSLVAYNTSSPKKNTGSSYSNTNSTVVPDSNTANLPPYYALAFIMRIT